MAIERTSRPFSATRIARLAHQLLDASTLCAIASVSPGGRAHVNTAYFAYTGDFEIVWISEPRARQSLNLQSSRTASIAVFDSHQTWGGDDRGIQLFGSAAKVVGAAAEGAKSTYARRFPEYVPEENSPYVPYTFRPRRMKLFDETSLGAGVFVTATVSPKGDITWERTEIYHATS
jgi:uncharacterized protein YhbP (UPF0306 family)